MPKTRKIRIDKNKYGKRLASGSGIDLHVWWVFHIYGKLLEGKFPMNFSRADGIGLPMASSLQDRPPAHPCVLEELQNPTP